MFLEFRSERDLGSDDFEKLHTVRTGWTETGSLPGMEPHGLEFDSGADPKEWTPTLESVRLTSMEGSQFRPQLPENLASRRTPYERLLDPNA